MVISNQAVWVLESTRERWSHRLFGRWRRHRSTSEEPIALLPGSLQIFAADGSLAKAPEVVMMQDSATAEPSEPDLSSPPLSAAERRARAVAVSGLMRVRDGQFEVARNLFAEAAALDPGLDLSTVPGFWNLPRPGQEAAVAAYELADRTGDAELLAANLRYRFRPKLVRRQPQPQPQPLAGVPQPNQ
jgi:hypothetical protein